MAATNYTPIQLYYSTTASAAPTSGNLASGELAINITDGKLYYKDNGGVVQVIATKGAGTIGGSTTQIQYNNAGALAGNAAMTFNSGTSTTTLTTLNLTNALGATYGGTAQSAYTQGDVLYASATNTLSKLGIGTVNYILTSTGSVPQWVAPTSITVNTATNLAGGAGGSVPYQSAADTTTFLAIGAANRVMTSSGTAPQWVTALTGLTGVSSSSITNTSLTSTRLVYSSTAGLQADSANLTFDGTTLSATGFSTTGLSTLVQTVKIGDSNFSGTAVFAAATPAKLYIGTGTVTDATSAIGATNAVGAVSSLAITPIAASNTSVTYTNAATLYIAGAPSAGTNVTLTNPYSLYVNAGAAYFGGAVTVAGSLSLAAVTVTSLTDSGNLTFTGTGNRITGDFSNATLASRVTFQTSTADGATDVQAIPNGIGTRAGFIAYNNSSIGSATANTQLLQLSTETRLVAGGSSPLPMTFYTGGSEAVRIGSGAASATDKGTVGIGYTALTGVGNNGLAVLGNVGIGTSSPTAKLHVYSNLTNGNPPIYADIGYASGGTAAAIRLNLNSGAGGAYLSGYNGSTDYLLNAEYIGSTGYVARYTTASIFTQDTEGIKWFYNQGLTAGNVFTPTERMRIDSSGNVGIGVTPSAWNSAYKALDVSAWGAIVGEFTTQGSTTVATNCYANSTGYNNWTFKNNAWATRYKQNDGIHSWLTSTASGTAGNAVTFNALMTLNTNGALALFGGSTSANGVGITFPATQSASSDVNTLDDYEEGTWTPALRGSGTAGTYTGTGVTGTYTKTGNMVTVCCRFSGFSAASGGTGYAQITGLPFINSAPAACAVRYDTLTLNALTVDVHLEFIGASGTVTLNFRENANAAGGLDTPISSFSTSTASILFSMCYLTST
jgi:hypothetical protein